MYVEGIILDCIDRIRTNRSIFGIYHLITGKKSIQSVHDARIFQLEKYYGIYVSLSREHFIQIINEMKKKEWIVEQGPDGYYVVSSAAKGLLNEYYDSSLYNDLNGLMLFGKDISFLERLYLLVQTYSNLEASHYSFIPILDNPSITNWVKQFYYNNGKKKVTKNLYHELHHVLSQLSNREAEIFVDRLSGFQHYGMSIDQLAIKYQFSNDDIKIILIAITHKLLTFIEGNREQYPILSQLIDTENENKFITNTANQTYQLLMNNSSLEDIAKKRNLKLSTIYDHIVEIALYDPDVDIQSFVSKEEQAQVVQAVKINKTLKLKTIKENCSPSIDYFQIRLVLTRLKELLPEEDFYV